MQQKKAKISSAGFNLALFDTIHTYATKHRKDPKAGDILLSFLSGECEHSFDKETNQCELCGVDKVHHSER
jgi:hypothetical protein